MSKNYDDNDDWQWVYGSSYEKKENYIQYNYIMAGGGSHWWHYVIRPNNNLYICSKSGYEKIDGNLIQSNCGNYFSIQKDDYELFDGELTIEYEYINHKEICEDCNEIKDDDYCDCFE